MPYRGLLMKQPVNFLEYPYWIVSSKKKLSKTIMHRDSFFYKMKSSEGLPTRLDRVVLYFLVQKLLQNNMSSPCVTITRYEIAKNIFSHAKSFSKQKYDRIMLALKRWNAFSLQFEDNFFDHGKKISAFHSVIDSFSIDQETHKLMIQFNDQYLEQVYDFVLYKGISIEAFKQFFSEYKRLARPLSARLYEILTKKLFYQYMWCIDIHYLKILLTLDEHHPPSRVLQLLKPAIEEINKCIQIHVIFDYDKQRSLCIFKIEDK